jgi:hypothetical protein
MDEAHRFLRYISPGALFLGETLGLLYLFLPSWVSGGLAAIKDAWIGVVFGGLITTGSLGFLLSAIHHVWFNRKPVINYSDLIDRLRSAGYIDVADAADPKGPSLKEPVGWFEAWVMVSSLSHQLFELSKRIKGVERRARRLADLTHSMGTALVSSVVALVVALLIACFVGDYSDNSRDRIRFILALVLQVIVFAVTIGTLEESASESSRNR